MYALDSDYWLLLRVDFNSVITRILFVHFSVDLLNDRVEVFFPVLFGHLLVCESALGDRKNGAAIGFKLVNFALVKDSSELEVILQFL